MTRTSKGSPYAAPVLSALALLLILGISLGVGIFGKGGTAALPKVATVPIPVGAADPEPPPARVPEPLPVDLETLDLPCWSCAEARTWEIRSRTDLDLIAPLGDGPGNAGQWIVAHLVPGRETSTLWAETAKRLEEGSGPFAGKQILPGDDPFLLAAEPWIDQRELRLYPDLLPFRGVETEFPQFLTLLALARSWVARGMESESPDRSLEDYRRVVRLGRLLRQEDVTVIADLVGIAIVRMGTEAIYDHARQEGDLELALASAAVLSELAPQRYLTSDRIRSMEVTRSALRYGEEMVVPNVVDLQLRRIAEEGSERRFRIEAIFQLAFVTRFGNADQRERAQELLGRLRQAPDPFIAYQAGWALDVDTERLKEVMAGFSDG